MTTNQTTCNGGQWNWQLSRLPIYTSEVRRLETEGPLKGQSKQGCSHDLGIVLYMSIALSYKIFLLVPETLGMQKNVSEDAALRYVHRLFTQLYS